MRKLNKEYKNNSNYTRLMNKILSFILKPASLIVLAAFALACNDKPSLVGEEVQPVIDKVTAKVDTLDMQVKTIEMGDIYTRSTNTLLGDIRDQVYGDLKADYIMQVRSPKGFKFKQKPIDDKIDSVLLSVNYNIWAGDSLAMLKASVYRIDKAIPNSWYSTEDLADLLDDKKHLGSKVYTVAGQQGIRRVMIKLPKELGQKIYDLTLNNPSVFDTQESFYQNVLGGLYITTTTGSGSVLNVKNTELVIFYTYKKRAEGGENEEEEPEPDPVGTEVFVNTTESYQVNHIKHQQLETLLAPSNEYTYVKSPAGVMTQLTINKDVLTEKYLTDLDEGYNWLISEAQFEVTTGAPPTETILDPPLYLLLLPKDSVQTFFEKHHTELSLPRVAFLSSPYSIVERKYNFNNLSLLFGEHIKENTKNEGGRKYVDKDLEMVMIPVSRQIKSNNSNAYTTVLNNYMFPTGVRLELNPKTARIGVFSTYYKSNL